MAEPFAGGKMEPYDDDWTEVLGKKLDLMS
jgi:hypothetical protein